MDKTLAEVRILHFVFVATWFVFLLLPWYSGTRDIGLPTFFPAALAFVCLTDITIAFVLRTRYVSNSAETLRLEPENRATLAKWRTGNLVSFAFAQTVTLFGFLVRFFGWGWNIAEYFTESDCCS